MFAAVNTMRLELRFVMNPVVVVEILFDLHRTRLAEAHRAPRNLFIASDTTTI